MNLHSQAQRSVLIAANPKSGVGAASRLTGELSRALQHRGYDCEIIHCLEQLEPRVQALRRERRLLAVVSAGGDGTVAALANLLPPDLPLLLFPLGTENLLARYWGLTTNIQLACDTLAGGQVVQMDVGVANGKLFLVMLSAGFDAQVVRLMQAQRTGPIRRWTYAWPIAKSLCQYRFPVMSWSGRGGPPGGSRQAAWLFAFNVPRYAAGLPICPQADPLDGQLDICTFQRAGILLGCYYLVRVWRQTHQRLPEWQQHRAGAFTVHPPLDLRGNPLEVPYQIDGDAGGLLPLKVDTLSARLRLLVPTVTEACHPALAASMPCAS